MRRAGLVAGLAVVLAVAAPFVRAIAAGDVVTVAGPSDLLHQNVALSHDYRERVRGDGALPLFRTQHFYGLETLADPQQRVLYPPMALYALLPFSPAHHLYWALHAVVLALGVFVLARGERCSRPAAVLGAVMLGLSWKTFAYLVAGWDNIHGAVAWVPLALALWRRALREPTPRATAAAALAGVPLALSCLAGTPLFFVYFAVGLPLTSLLPARRRPRRVLLVAALAFGVGFALASPQLLPSLSLAARSARAHMRTTYGTVLPSDVVGALAYPDFTRTDYSWEFGNALGLVALPLAGAGWARRRRIPWAAWLAVVFGLLALGDTTPVGKLLALVPVVGTLSYLSRLAWVVALAEALLAAQGLDALLRLGDARPGRRRRIVTGLAAGAVLLALGAVVPGRAERLRPEGVSAGATVAALVGGVALAGALVLLPFARARTRRGVALALVGLTVVELWALAELEAVRVPLATFVSPSKIDAALEREPLARIATVSSDRMDPVWPFYESLGVDRADGYNPLHTLDAERFLGAVAPDRIHGRWMPYVQLQRVDRADLLALGVTHVLAREPIQGFPVVAEDSRRVLTNAGEWREGRVLLLRVPGALPRSFVVSRARSVPAAEQLDALLAAPFDGGSTLLVDGPVPRALEGAGEAPLPATVVERRANLVRVRATAPAGGGWLVLLDAWASDWGARVDGRPAPLLRADALFRAVLLEEGEHEVVFEIGWPASFLVGAALAAAGLAFVGFAAVRARRGARARSLRPPPPSPPSA